MTEYETRVNHLEYVLSQISHWVGKLDILPITAHENIKDIIRTYIDGEKP